MKLKKLDNLFRRAHIIAENSPDEETQVGCIIVRPDGSEIASSYNGFILGAPDSQLPKTRPQKHDYMLHGEVNAVCQAAKHGVSIEGCIALVTLSPCINCCRVLWQCGVRTIYFHQEYKDFQKQLNMLDLKFNLTKIGKYTKIELEAR
jgi:dCMP deaminase